MMGSYNVNAKGNPMTKPVEILSIHGATVIVRIGKAVGVIPASLLKEWNSRETARRVENAQAVLAKAEGK